MRHCLVTGGSSGIGLSVALMLAKRGCRISIVARNAPRLEAAKAHLLANGIDRERVHIHSADVTDPDLLLSAVEACEGKFGEIDTLLASAGMVKPALFFDQTRQDFDQQIASNLIGVTNSVRSVYPKMVQRGKGRIMIVSSVAGLIGIPGYSAYCASKYALRGFAAALRLEAQPLGVNISICFPPDTKTRQLEEETLLRPHESRVFMGKSMPWPVEQVAKRIIRSLESAKPETHFGMKFTLLAWLQPFIAATLSSRYLYRMKR